MSVFAVALTPKERGVILVALAKYTPASESEQEAVSNIKQMLKRPVRVKQLREVSE